MHCDEDETTIAESKLPVNTEGIRARRGRQEAIKLTRIDPKDDQYRVEAEDGGAVEDTDVFLACRISRSRTLNVGADAIHKQAC